MIQVFYATAPNELPDFESALSSMPTPIRDYVNRYHYFKDAGLALTSRLLLQHALRTNHLADNLLEMILSDNYKRPYIPGCPDFNLSHTGNVAVCAFSTEGRVGIDIEKIQPIELDDFEGIWTPAELQFIQHDHSRFFYYWTRKEAIIKADGRGLHLPLQLIDVSKDQVLLDQKSWQLQELFLLPGYKAHIATDLPALLPPVINQVNLF
ncbi:4'-phosphopantetheinyl transferase superfamily protein [Chitinophaga sp. Cy-1792]|uniref:4'-phosphopantetheinyl transferase family protein n=1 Tax=Chitinophaga sp. Cy-1792 TaxID=2608339 RepID=UPI001421DB5D|nr:4'-phosphopantetheinyl transferase superfamily protein [Chitinophaga sp. Cy-1792]NIG56059.1 4'-phosphopantetheinyl transferase superfamily protein [Chitinophaga sp. Cy-1792]